MRRQIVRLAGMIFSRLSIWFYILAGYITLVMACIITYDVVCRYALNSPTDWAVDISEYMMVSLPMLAAAYLLQNDGHISLGIVIDHFNPKTRMMVNFITSIVGLLACIVLTWQSGGATWDLLENGVKVMRPLAVPKWTVWAVLPLGSLMVSIAFVQRVYRFWAGWHSNSIEQMPEPPE